MVRRPRRYAAADDAGRLSARDGAGFLWSARQEHGAAAPTAFRRQDGVAPLCRTDRRVEEAGHEAGNGVWDWPRLPHRVLGAALRRRVWQRGGVEAANAPAGGKA